METAISSGVSAAMSRPTGAQIASTFAASKPSALACSRMSLVLRALPIMKVFKSPGARARVKAVLDAEGLDMQGADAVSFSAFAHHSEAPKAVADEFVELEKAGLKARAGLSAAKRASERKGSSR